MRGILRVADGDGEHACGLRVSKLRVGVDDGAARSIMHYQHVDAWDCREVGGRAIWT